MRKISNFSINVFGVFWNKLKQILHPYRYYIFILKVWSFLGRVWISFRNWVCKHIVISTIIAVILIMLSIFLMVSGHG